MYAAQRGDMQIILSSLSSTGFLYVTLRRAQDVNERERVEEGRERERKKEGRYVDRDGE